MWRLWRAVRKDPVTTLLAAAAVVVLVLAVSRKEGLAAAPDDTAKKVRGYCRQRGRDEDAAQEAAKAQYGDSDTVREWCSRGVAMYEARRDCKLGRMSMGDTKDAYKDRLTPSEAEWACRMGWKQRGREYNATRNRDDGACTASGTYCPNIILRKSKPCKDKDRDDRCCEFDGSGCTKITQHMIDRGNVEWNAQDENTRPGSGENAACTPSSGALQGCTYYNKSTVNGKKKCWQGHFATKHGGRFACAIDVQCKNKANNSSENDRTC
jgi:hypothetical protein